MSGRSSSHKRSNASMTLSRNYQFFYQTGATMNYTPSQLLKIVNLDHSYSLPSAPQEKKTPAFPVRYLFQSDDEIQALNEPKTKLENLLVKKSGSKRSQRPKPAEEEEIDIFALDQPPKIPYDPAKAKNLMAECEKNVNFARMTEAPENWEEAIVQIGWTKPQKRLFRKIIQVLHDEHLARLAYSDSAPEPLLRRLSMDKTAQRFRSILTQFAWDTKLTQWLHSVLVDNLSFDYLSEYLDILQTLRIKVPTLIDRMITLSTSAATADPVHADALHLLLKRPWDPFATSIHPSKIKKPPPSINPVFVFVPSGPAGSSGLCPHRQKSFLAMLSGVGKVVSVSAPTATDVSVEEYVAKMLEVSKAKVHEVIATNQDKSVWIVGWGNGAIVAAMVSLEIDVAGVVCLGFPIHGLAGTRMDVEDPLHGLKQPTLFVVGDRSTNNSVTDMEIFRKDLNCVSALSVVCQADAALRVTNYHQKRLLVTQSYVDKCIVEEISWFLANIPILEQELKVQALEEEEQALHYDGPKAIPSNSSASKRKAYYRPKDSNSTASPNYVTASKLIQPPPSKRKNLGPVGPSRTPAVLASSKSSKHSAVTQPGSLSSTTSTASALSKQPALAVPPPTVCSMGTQSVPPPTRSPILKASLARPVGETMSSSGQSGSPFQAKGTSLSQPGSPFQAKAPNAGQPGVPFQAKTSFVVKTGAAAKPAHSEPPSKIPRVSEKASPVSTYARSDQWKAAGNVLGTSAGSTVTTATTKPLVTKPPTAQSTSAEDSQILRRLITSAASSTASLTSSALTLPRDTTATLSPHPLRSATPSHQQRLQFITSLLPNQQTEPGKSTILSLQHPNMSPQLIRITPIMTSQTSTSTTATSTVGQLQQPPQERPLPTRCTDESLRVHDPAEEMTQKSQINPDLFQHLKSTLSVSNRDKGSSSSSLPPTVRPVPSPGSLVTALPSAPASAAVAVTSSAPPSTATASAPESSKNEKLVTVSLEGAGSKMTPQSAAVEIEKVLKSGFNDDELSSTTNSSSQAVVPKEQSSTVSRAEGNEVKLGGTVSDGSSEAKTSKGDVKEPTVLLERIDVVKGDKASSGSSKVGTVRATAVTQAKPSSDSAAPRNDPKAPKEAHPEVIDISSSPPRSTKTVTAPSLASETAVQVAKVTCDSTKVATATRATSNPTVSTATGSSATSRSLDTHAGTQTDTSKAAPVASIADSEAPESKETPKSQSLPSADSKNENNVTFTATTDTPGTSRSAKKSPARSSSSSSSKKSSKSSPGTNEPSISRGRSIEKTPVKRKHDDSTGSSNSRRHTRASSIGDSGDDQRSASKSHDEPQSKRRARSRSRSSTSRRSNQASPETIEILSSEDETTPRVTRSKARSTTTVSSSTTSQSSSGEETMKQRPKGEEEEVLIVEEDDDEEGEDGEEGESGEKKKHLKPIYPVTPASLSATRTRKISIPNYFSFGM